MIGIVDYGMGNLRSVLKALHHLGHKAEWVSGPEAVRGLSRLVLPGVGAFPDAMRALEERRLTPAIREFVRSGRPLLGICLGMQVLFSESEEFGRNAGLDLIPGRVVRFSAGGLKVPHMGWNTLTVTRPSPLFGDFRAGGAVYFVHSYYCVPKDSGVVTATADYGGAFAATVQHENIIACQFHPEKSQAVGLRLLDNFARWNP